MTACSCDRLADMLLTAAMFLAFYPFIRLLLITIGYDEAVEKVMDLTAKYGNWLFVIAAFIGAWWFFWR